MACASWKCSSTYWERFNKALLNATEESNVTKADMMHDDNAIRGKKSKSYIREVPKKASVVRGAFCVNINFPIVDSFVG